MNGLGEANFTERPIGAAPGTAAPSRLGTGSPGVGTYLRGDGAWAAMGKPARQLVYTTPGADTYTPAAGTVAFVVELLGGGGGGGGVAGAGGQCAAGGCGGNGAYVRRLYQHDGSAYYDLVVGDAGTPASAGNNPGGTGGTSAFNGSQLSADGGGGGDGMAAGSTLEMAAGGGGGGFVVYDAAADIGAAGAAGGPGIRLSATAAITMGTPSTQFCGGTPASSTAAGSNDGRNADGYGVGGGGALANDATDHAGGAGGGGLVVITEYAG